VKPAIICEEVSVALGPRRVLESITMEVAQGEFAGIIGPNGAGKTTLLRAILGLHKPWRGEIHVMGSGRQPDRRRLGYTPQSEQVDWSFPVTVLDVVLMGRYGGLGPLRRPTKADHEIARRALESVRLADLADRRIGELSGGQRQRVAVARAIAGGPPLILGDEPTASLDLASGLVVMEILRELARERGHTVVVVTHDTRIFHFANRVVHIDDGRIQKEAA
jgi:ABC-type Mn2+/Zn2+ transport system ATPase subunit